MTGVIINNNEYQVSTGGIKIEYSSMGGGTIGYSMYGDEVPSSVTVYTFTINATPVDSVVTINGTQQSSITAEEGSSIVWSVSKTGYTTQTGSLILNSDVTETVNLQITPVWESLTSSAFSNDCTVRKTSTSSTLVNDVKKLFKFQQITKTYTPDNVIITWPYEIRLDNLTISIKNNYKYVSSSIYIAFGEYSKSITVQGTDEKTLRISGISNSMSIYTSVSSSAYNWIMNMTDFVAYKKK